MSNHDPEAALQPQQTSCPPLSPRLLRVSEAAAYSGATCWFIRERIWDGDIPHVRFGKRLLVDKKDLDSYIEREKQKGIR